MARPEVLPLLFGTNSGCHGLCDPAVCPLCEGRERDALVPLQPLKCLFCSFAYIRIMIASCLFQGGPDLCPS